MPYVGARRGRDHFFMTMRVASTDPLGRFRVSSDVGSREILKAKEVLRVSGRSTALSASSEARIYVHKFWFFFGS